MKEETKKPAERSGEKESKLKALSSPAKPKILTANKNLNELILAELKTEEEQKYLQNLAHKYVQNKPKNFLIARSIVLDIHIKFDRIISSLIGLFCIIGILKVKRSFNKNPYDGLIEKLGYIEYSRKLKVIAELELFTQSSLIILWKVNALRNAFAHDRDITHHDYNYNGNTIFERETIDKLIKDNEIVKTEVADIIKRYESNN